MSDAGSPVGELSELVNRIADRNETRGADVWPDFVTTGLDRIAVPEIAGGSGGTLRDAVEVIRACSGRALSVPLIESIMASDVLAQAGVDIPDGLVVLHSAPTDVIGPDQRMTGDLIGVRWGRSASAIVLVGSGGSAWLVHTDQPGVSVEPDDNIAGEPWDLVRLEGAHGTQVSRGGDLARLQRRQGVFWASALVGASEAAFALTQEHVGSRQQFGAPLVKLPAVQRSLALMRVEIIQAVAALEIGLGSMGSDTPDSVDVGLVRAAIARSTAASAATEVARLAHQLHGAIGVTAEYPLHRYTTRLWAWRDLVEPEREWVQHIGRATAAGGESVVWDRLTTAAGSAA